MKAINLKNKVPKEYRPYIYDISFWDDVYTCNLIECCCIDGESHIFNADTLEELIEDMSEIDIIKDEETYISIFGDGLIEDYRKSFAKLMKQINLA